MVPHSRKRHFLAKELLKLNKTINTCLIRLNIILYYSLPLNTCECLIFLLKLSSLLSKSVLLATLTCFSLVAKFSAVKLLNSAVIYLVQSRILFFVLRTVVVTKLLACGILF